MNVSDFFCDDVKPRIGNATVDKMIKPAVIFMVCGALPVVFITTYWPDLSLFIPRLLMPDVVG